MADGLIPAAMWHVAMGWHDFEFRWWQHHAMWFWYDMTFNSLGGSTYSKVYCASHWGTRRSFMCLTVGHRARFAVPNSGAWGEVCCAWQWGIGLCCVWQWGVMLGLLCLTVRHRAKLAVPDSGAQARFAGVQGKVGCAWQWHVERGLLCIKVWHRVRFVTECIWQIWGA